MIRCVVICVMWDDLLTTNFTSDSIWSAFCDILNEAIALFVQSVIKSTEYKARRTTYPKLSTYAYYCNANEQFGRSIEKTQVIQI